VLKNCWHGWGFEPTTLDLGSQSGAFDLSTTVSFSLLILQLLMFISAYLSTNESNVLSSHHNHSLKIFSSYLVKLHLKDGKTFCSFFTPNLYLFVNLNMLFDCHFSFLIHLEVVELL